MDEQLAILLGICVLGYLFLSPIILIVLNVKQRKSINWLEEELRILKESLQEQRERLAHMRQDESVVQDQAPEPVPEPIPEPALEPAPDPAKVSKLEQQLEKAFQKRTSPYKEEPSPPTPEPAQPVAAVPPVHEVHSVHFSETLRRIGMWPPASDSGMSRETVLMQWWLPRVGGLLALLSALFFAVYINQNTSPLFKCMELVAVSVGVSALGLFMERKYKTFGGVLFVTGLIMLYLTSIAAYVVTATRVIESPLVGSIVQASVLLAICVVGLFRRSLGTVFLAFCFGYFLSLFMVYESLREGALLEAGLLFFAGMALSRKELLKPLVWVIVPGSFLTVLAFSILPEFHSISVPESLSVLLYINIVFAGIAGAYFAGFLLEGKLSRILLSIASSLAIASTFLYYQVHDPAYREWASLVLGLLMLAASIFAWARRGCGYAMQLLFIKASFLVGVWAILHFAGDLRWMVLALQTVVVAVAARRAKVLAMELTVWAVAFASFIYFTNAIGNFADETAFVWWMMVLYPAVITLALAYLFTAYGKGFQLSKEISRDWAYAAVPIVAIALWNVVFEETHNGAFDMALPFIFIVYLAAACSLIPFIKRWMLLELSGLAFVVGVAHFCDEPFSILQLGGIILAAAAALHFLVRDESKPAIVGERVVYLLVILPVSLWALQVMDDWAGQQVIMLLLCGGILLGGLVPRIRQLGSWSFVPLLVYMLTESAIPGSKPWVLVAYFAGLGWLLIPVLLPTVKAGMGWASKSDLWAIIGSVLFWFLVILFGDPITTWISGQLVMGIMALLLLIGAHRFKMHGFLLGALLFTATGAGRQFMTMLGEIDEALWKTEILVSAGLLYAFAILWFFLKPIPFGEEKEELRNGCLKVTSAASALLFFLVSLVTFQNDDLGWIAWYTPIMAITAFAMILLGLVFRDTVFRQLGLIGLLFPLIRLFVVDVQDVLHRIIAFAAAAILLTVLGYLYHRLSTHLSDPDASGDESPGEGDQGT